MRRRHVLWVLALAGLVAAACAGGQSSSGPVSIPAPQVGSGAAVDSAKGNVASGISPANGIPSLALPNRDLIMTANVSMKSEDPWKTADRARAIARDLGGGILSFNESGSADKRSATVVMSVPATRFDDAIAALKSLDGEVISSSLDAKDVTDQLVDLDARVTALKTEEGRYLQLFARANTVDEMLKVQIALSQLRTQIEQLSAQQKNLKDRVVFSTISLSIAPIGVPTPTEPVAKWDPSKTFATAAAALVALLRVFADLAIWLGVFVPIPLFALALAFLATRTRRRLPST